MIEARIVSAAMAKTKSFKKILLAFILRKLYNQLWVAIDARCVIVVELFSQFEVNETEIPFPVRWKWLMYRLYYRPLVRLRTIHLNIQPGCRYELNKFKTWFIKC